MKPSLAYSSESFSLDSGFVQRLVHLALEEDAITHDVSTQALFSKEALAKAYVEARETGILCGMPIFTMVLEEAAALLNLPKAQMQVFIKEGQALQVGQKVVQLQGRLHLLLAAERTALNFLSLLSGIATQVRQAASLVKKQGIFILDTRKTIPGFRELSKYAVFVGGGKNHRLHLADMGMLKDNHLAHLPPGETLQKAVLRFRQKFPQLPLEVEVENKKQLLAALESGVLHILLDNMTPPEIQEAVSITRAFEKKHGQKITLEASGGYHLNNIQDIIDSGVDFISMGKLTSQITPIDFSLEISPS